MIDARGLAEVSPQAVAQKVAEYLKDCHPGGVTIEVDPEGIVRGEFEWRARVRPSQEPPSLMEYYEALTTVEMELDEREHLNVFLVPSDPQGSQASELTRQGDENGALPSPSADKPERRLRTARRAIASKAGERPLTPKPSQES